MPNAYIEIQHEGVARRALVSLPIDWMLFAPLPLIIVFAPEDAITTLNRQFSFWRLWEKESIARGRGITSEKTVDAVPFNSDRGSGAWVPASPDPIAHGRAIILTVEALPMMFGGTSDDGSTRLNAKWNVGPWIGESGVALSADDFGATGELVLALEVRTAAALQAAEVLDAAGNPKLIPIDLCRIYACGYSSGGCMALLVGSFGYLMSRIPEPARVVLEAAGLVAADDIDRTYNIAAVAARAGTIGGRLYWGKVPGALVPIDVTTVPQLVCPDVQNTPNSGAKTPVMFIQGTRDSSVADLWLDELLGFYAHPIDATGSVARSEVDRGLQSLAQWPQQNRWVPNAEAAESDTAYAAARFDYSLFYAVETWIGSFGAVGPTADALHTDFIDDVLDHIDVPEFWLVAGDVSEVQWNVVGGDGVTRTWLRCVYLTDWTHEFESDSAVFDVAAEVWRFFIQHNSCGDPDTGDPVDGVLAKSVGDSRRSPNPRRGHRQ